MRECERVNARQGDPGFSREDELCVGLPDLEATAKVAKDILEINHWHFGSHLQLVADNVLVGVVNRSKMDTMTAVLNRLIILKTARVSDRQMTSVADREDWHDHLEYSAYLP